MKRLRFYGLILTPLLVAALVLVWMITTESGLRATLRLVNRLTPVTIMHEGLSGHLSAFSASSFMIALPTQELVVQDLYVSWQPLPLLTGKLMVNQASAASVSVTPTQPQSEQEPVAFDMAAFDPAAINLPIDIEIDGLTIGTVIIADRVAIEDLSLQAVLEDTRWSIEQFSAITGQGEISMTATVQARDDWAHAFSIDAVHKEYGPARVSISGNRNTTDGTIEVPSIAAVAALTVRDLFAKPAWQLQATIGDLTSFGRSGSLRLAGQGTSDSGTMTLAATVDAVQAQLDEIRFRVVDSALDLAVNGQIAKTPITFTGVISGTELRQAELTLGVHELAPDRRLKQAVLNIKGPWTALEFTAKASGRYLQPFELAAAGTLIDSRSIEFTDISAAAFAGTMKGNAVVQLADEVSGNGNLAFLNVDLSTFDARLPSAVSGEAEARLQGQRLNASLRNISAQVLGSDVPVTGKGAVSIDNGVLSNASLALRVSADNRIDLTYPRTGADLDVSLAVGALNAFIAGASGAAKGQFKINAQHQMINGELQLSDIAIPQAMSIAAASIQASGDKNGQTLTINGEALQLSGFAMATVSAVAKGTLASHHVEAEANLIDGQQVSLVLDGKWQDRAWQFVLEQLRLTYDGLGAQLEAPAAGVLSATVRELQPLCLQVQGDGKACASLKQSSGLLALTVNLSLPPGKSGLEVWLRQFDLPAFRMEQGLVMSADLLQRDGMLERFVVNGAVPVLLWPAPDGEAVELTDISVKATGTQDAVNFSSVIKGAGGAMEASGTIMGLAAPQVNGVLTVSLPDLPALSALVSDLDLQRGRLNGNLRFQGPLKQPLISGAVELEDLQLVWPTLGTRHEGNISITAGDSGRGVVSGELRSANGAATVTGTVDWQPLPTVIMQLKGDNFLFADTAELSVAASPDLQVQWRPDKYSLTGSIAIERAFSSLNLPGLQTTAVMSRDVVFVDEQQSAPNDMTGEATVDVVAEFKQPGKIDGRGITGEVDGRVRISQQPGKPAVANGILRLTGTYRAFGQLLNIENGQLIYTNTPIGDPVISAYASRTIDEIKAGVRIEGRASALITRLESTPAMPEGDILHYLVLGRAPGVASESEQNQLSAAAINLALSRSEAGVQSIGERLGVTELGITQELGMLALAVGKQISPRLYVSYTVGLLEPIDIARVRYKVSRRVSLEAEVADESRAGVRYRIEKD